MAESSYGDPHTGQLTVPPRSFASGDIVLSCEPWVWSFAYQNYSKRCAYCFKESDSLLTCSSCKLHRYCNKECQVISWKKEHKHECEGLKVTHGVIQKTCCMHTFDITCREPGCCYSGCFTKEILWSKILSKVESGKKESMPGFKEKMSALDILQSLPRNVKYKYQGPVQAPVPKNVWPSAAKAIYKLPNSNLLMQTVHYNALPLTDTLDRIAYAMALFPQYPFRAMTPVCWDTNVTMTMQGRILKVIATENIINYSGLEDLRENELLARVVFFSTLEARRKMFHNIYLGECTCRKCTNTYDAEINPLKCATKGCTERIPSDERALEPCPQCGALNGDRLMKFKGLKVKLFTAYGMPDERLGMNNRQLMRVPVQLDELDILHADAHFYYACNAIHEDDLLESGQYAQAWTKYSGMVACVRAIYPRYHFGRAQCLFKGYEIPRAWLQDVFPSDFEKFFHEVVPTLLEWLKEAQEIYIKLSGPDSKEVHETEERAAPFKCLWDQVRTRRFA